MRLSSDQASSLSPAIDSMSKKFDAAIVDTSSSSVSGAPAASVDSSATGASLDSTLNAIKQTLQTLQQLIQSLIQSLSQKNPSGGSALQQNGSVMPVEGSGNLGGSHGPSERIPDPTEHVREITLGDKTMTVGGDGSASEGEVDAAAAELQRMYNASPSFKQSIDNAQSSDLTFTVGRRSDNTSWGGGGRVFLNINNVTPGNNDRFQGLVGHEFGHAAQGLHHGAELDSLEARVRAEA